MITHSIPRGIFRGSNFMTPEWIEYRKRNMRGRVAYIEISEGRGMYDEPIYGVTFRRADGERFEDDPSGVFYSLADAREHAEESE